MWNCLYNIDLYNAFTLSLCFFICYYYPVTKWKVKKWWEYYFLRLYLIDFCFIYSLYGTLNALIISTFVFLSIFSHARASYFDPGFVPLPKKGIDFSDVNTNDNTKVKYSIEFDSFKKKRFLNSIVAKCWWLDGYVMKEWRNLLLLFFCLVCNRCDTYRPARSHHCR